VNGDVISMVVNNCIVVCVSCDAFWKNITKLVILKGIIRSFQIMITVLTIQPKRCTNFSNLFLE